MVAKPGVDLSKQGEKLVDAFTGQAEIGDVVLDLDRSTVDVTFCESQQSPESVKQILESTGLVTVNSPQSAAPPATATLDKSGKKQTAQVNAAGGTFSPQTIVLKSGVPVELTFGPADGCATEAIFSGLGVEHKLAAGPTKLKLPALEPGTYDFACAMGHATGQLVVE